MNRCFFVDDTALRILFVRLLVLLELVDALQHDFDCALEDFRDLAFFAGIFAAHDPHFDSSFELLSSHLLFGLND